MSAHVHGWSLRRHVPEGVTPLEVWNLPVLGHELWEVLGSERVERDRRAGLPESMLAFHLLPVLAGALSELIPRHDADAVWLSGGLACLEGFEALLSGMASLLPCPVYVAEEPRFAPVRAGLRLLEPLRPTSPVAFDVGQTSIKCASPQATRVIERDTEAVPLRLIGTPRPRDGHHVRAAVDFIGGALRAFITEGASPAGATATPRAGSDATPEAPLDARSMGPPPTAGSGATPEAPPDAQSMRLPPTAGSGATPESLPDARGVKRPLDALCLALPCPVDGTFIPGGCTYGWEGHASLVADLLQAAGLTDASSGGTVLVLNDAELAAEAAREDARLADSRRVLCLTLGFGPGGALLERASR
jgi:hypothetical protein